MGNLALWLVAAEPSSELRKEECSPDSIVVGNARLILKSSKGSLLSFLLSLLDTRQVPRMSIPNTFPPANNVAGFNYPAADYAAPTEQRGGISTGATVAIAAIVGLCLAAIVAGVMAFMGKSGGSDAADAASPVLVSTAQDVAPVTVTEQRPATVTVQAPEPVAPVQRVTQAPSYSSGYSSYRALTGNTSQSFAANVYSSFVSNYAATGSPNATLKVYSPVTGRNYYMYCSGTSSSVRCSGGDNAAVLIY